MELSVYINGKFLPQSEAKVSVFDHGLLYGDGVFEGIRAYNGRVFKLERHMDRLFHSAKAIDLKIPHTKEDLAKIILETCRHNDMKEGYISPTIKSLNYLNNSMAKVEANQYGADEALMLDIHGYVSEASAENIFIVRNHTIVTPFTSTNLPGVTRETVLELAPSLGLESKEQFFTLYAVWAADEAFITGSAAEVAPVVEVDGRTIGDGKPGPTTKKIMKAFRDLVMSTGTPI